MSQVYLITGASTGFGALSARALAKEGHIVFAGMYSHDGNTAGYEEDAATFSRDNNADLRTVPLNLLLQESVDAAVKHIIDAVGRIDVVVHNAGHMNYGPAESFTAEQCLRLYDVNVVGCQRLNMAALPHMRRARRGHVVWVGSASTYGANSPYLGPYFAAKAAQDHLAQSYAAELTAWGIETTIVSPGVLTKGTNHFADAAMPGRPDVAREYADGPTKDLGERTMTGTAALVPPDAGPEIVSDALVEIARLPRGKKPFRVFPDVTMAGAPAAAGVIDNNRVNMYRRMGILEYLTVQL
ncbi:putative short-chain dehydrogenase reductase SDR [Rosellinia necatrix]|uniref:Putative short-chain dehydrogenase reductase SDR n=1 Tax=Rosellinia necatrix TaxID=77044 RepID=A0A1W2TE19_ROSNE|nr:putative short-chain dehydrogenase reductase SDR [Rosellinia necatrix]